MKALTQALHESIEREDLEEVQRLIERQGADIEDGDDSGETALHVACYNNNRLDIVTYLVQNCKANVEAVSYNHFSVLRMACHRNKTEMVQYLLTLGGARVDGFCGKGTILHFAASLWVTRKEMIQCLVLECGVNVNARDDFGRTALHLACRYSGLDTILCLVETCGADVYAKDKNGQTAFHHAVVCPFINLLGRCRILVLDRVLDMSVDNSGHTALHIVASHASRRETVATWRGLILLVEHVAADYM